MPETRDRQTTRLEGNPKTSRICLLAGMLDGLVFVSYLFEVDQTYYYSATVLLKLALLFALNSGLKPASRSSFAFLYTLILVEIISSVVNDVAVLSSIRVIVFCINLAVTLNFIGTSYWRGLVLVTTVDALAYLALLETGGISSVYGRYMFFSNSHPNLGSEIFFSGAYACLLTKTPRLSMLLVPLYFIPAFFMQGRAAELGILCVACVLVWNSGKQMTELGKLVLFACIAMIGVTIALSLDVSGIINKVLLLDSQYRGENTNASGRSLNWAAGFEAWFSNPLFGAGSDYPTRLAMLQPHNFFLYPLAYYGAMGFVVLFIFIKKFAELLIFGRLIYALPFIPMLAFNDRFVNLNIYPTIMFLFVFSESAKIAQERGWRRPVSIKLERTARS